MSKLNGWWNRSRPEEIKPYPWLHPAVILYLDKLIQPEWTVCEHGAGGSTLWLAERCKHVLSIESNKEWYEQVKKAIPPNVELVYFPDPGIAREAIGPYDLMLIDGEPVENRLFYIVYAKRLVRPGGVVVLDNANRTEYSDVRTRFVSETAHHVTFHMNPPRHAYAVTEFYRMPGGATDEEKWI